MISNVSRLWMSESILCHWWRYSPLAHKLKVQMLVCHSSRPKVLFVENSEQLPNLSSDYSSSFSMVISFGNFRNSLNSSTFNWHFAVLLVTEQLPGLREVRVSFVETTCRSVSACNYSGFFRGPNSSFFLLSRDSWQWLGSPCSKTSPGTSSSSQYSPAFAVQGVQSSVGFGCECFGCWLRGCLCQLFRASPLTSRRRTLHAQLI